LVIRFYCEGCEAISTLSISQHKGKTYFSSDYFFNSYKEKYYNYLQSPEWDEKRKAKLKEADFRCQLCNAEDKLSVHHRTYERVFEELQSDLIALCSRCHSKYHDVPLPE